MTLVINSPAPVSTDIDTGAELKTAKLVKNQQEIEGQLALELISSAAATAIESLPVVGNSGHNINIKV